jgi:hypothetical protein
LPPPEKLAEDAAKLATMLSDAADTDVDVQAMRLRHWITSGAALLDMVRPNIYP